ncbi:MAG: ketoacyl-ACP synthase III [Proteobacteria bacterium]|nr:ketoacyl-ACP synthase III [Pseudomonadota bacterium]MBU0966140.1 ketoacyl-ACP synthase III [Pseudomonadota bacterium]
MNRMVVLGTGSALPAKVLSNADLEKMVDTSDEWITTRTGIKNRRIAVQGEETSKLATLAAGRALEMAKLSPDEIDMIIVGTITPDMGMPSCACLVQKELGATRAFALDINAACSGFVFCLDVADKYIKADPDMKILVVGAETLSSRVNWEDRNTCVLFGDGAGACLVTGTTEHRGMLASKLFSDGSLYKLLYMDNVPSMNKNLASQDNDGSYIKMAGRDVFKYAVRSMDMAIMNVLDQVQVSVDDIALFIPHQANIRILKSLGERLGIASEKVYINLDKYGNTSAASIPIALDEANREGRINAGDLVLLCAFGGGFTWGATLFRW